VTSRDCLRHSRAYIEDVYSGTRDRVFKNKLRQLLRDRMRRIKISYEEPYKVFPSLILILFVVSKRIEKKT
jgi:hypothetical protein